MAIYQGLTNALVFFLFLQLFLFFFCICCKNTFCIYLGFCVLLSSTNLHFLHPSYIPYLACFVRHHQVLTAYWITYCRWANFGSVFSTVFTSSFTFLNLLRALYLPSSLITPVRSLTGSIRAMHIPFQCFIFDSGLGALSGRFIIGPRPSRLRINLLHRTL